MDFFLHKIFANRLLSIIGYGNKMLVKHFYYLSNFIEITVALDKCLNQNLQLTN